MPAKKKDPCETHPEAKRYGNGACSGCVIEKQKQRYRNNIEAAKEYAKEYAQRNPRPKMTDAERLAYNARRRANYRIKRQAEAVK